ncbi:hypothetical protein J6590_035290 [Homalodisca vitripennis]|nr:hypothetical protein J6590_035290 [Homalodisca vitripennis]
MNMNIEFIDHVGGLQTVSTPNYTESGKLHQPVPRDVLCHVSHVAGCAVKVRMRCNNTCAGTPLPGSAEEPWRINPGRDFKGFSPHKRGSSKTISCNPCPWKPLRSRRGVGPIGPNPQALSGRTSLNPDPRISLLAGHQLDNDGWCSFTVKDWYTMSCYHRLLLQGDVHGSGCVNLNVVDDFDLGVWNAIYFQVRLTRVAPSSVGISRDLGLHSSD